MAEMRSGIDADDALFAVRPPFFFETGSGARNSLSRGYAPSAATVAWPLKRMLPSEISGDSPRAWRLRLRMSPSMFHRSESPNRLPSAERVRLASRLAEVAVSDALPSARVALRVASARVLPRYVTLRRSIPASMRVPGANGSKPLPSTFTVASISRMPRPGIMLCTGKVLASRSMS